MENLLSTSRKPDITFYASGKIEISTHVVKELSLKPGDKLNAGIESGQYYIYVSRSEELIGRHDATCWPTNPGGRHLRAYSKRLCDAIIGQGQTPARLNVGQTLHHPILGPMLPLIIRLSDEAKHKITYRQTQNQRP